MTAAIQGRLTAAKGHSYQVAVTKHEIANEELVPPTTKRVSFKAKAAPPLEFRNQSLPESVNTALNLSSITTTTSAGNLSLTTSSMTGNIVPAGSSSGSGSSGSDNSLWFGAGGIGVAWVVVACCIAAVFFMKKKRKVTTKKPSKESYLPMDSEDETEDDFEQMPVLNKHQCEEEYEGMESQFMAVRPAATSQYTGEPYSAQPAAAPAAAPSVYTQAPASMFQAAPPTSMYQASPPTSMYQAAPPANPANGLIGLNLPPTIYG
jgi:phosphate/sulfate permease